MKRSIVVVLLLLLLSLLCLLLLLLTMFHSGWTLLVLCLKHANEVAARRQSRDGIHWRALAVIVMYSKNKTHHSIAVCVSTSDTAAAAQESWGGTAWAGSGRKCAPNNHHEP